MRADALRQKLLRAAENLSAAAEEICASAAGAAAAGARERVPVDTGALRGSIGSAPRGDMCASAYAGTDHAAAVEFGTSRRAPAPFLRPAAYAVREEFVQSMKEAARKAAQ